ncbi:MAG TPA: LLM class flavin-dependent oxidoreductase [Baekduia sp.]|uniref:LLM class flavin-dependent oxidoreductase n=1 Tax=Baekduia sp. TaxID=2600305 RepID=UPI002D799094|nr:LLM class flavin-dependent oxidoreductase [Baekduia sp.]HET6509706.1 LLM class flavin-dependent oxidoreductase [Baekduia sp.]
MRHAVYCASYGSLADPAALVGLARRAERAGWDGFFLYDHVVVEGEPTADPWTTLGAVAAATEDIVLGPLIVPVARRRPWELAHQVATLERLAPGRTVLGVGRGVPEEFRAFGDRPTPREVGRRLDEGIDLVCRLLAGEAVDHAGTWRLRGARLIDPPVRVPIWVGGTHDKPGALARAGRHDGAFLIGEGWGAGHELTPEQVRRVAVTTGARDVVHAGISPPDRAAARALAQRYAAAGATWWLEVLQDDFGPVLTTLADHRRRVEAGPPR